MPDIGRTDADSTDLGSMGCWGMNFQCWMGGRSPTSRHSTRSALLLGTASRTKRPEEERTACTVNSCCMAIEHGHFRRQRSDDSDTLRALLNITLAAVADGGNPADARRFVRSKTVGRRGGMPTSHHRLRHHLRLHVAGRAALHIDDLL